MHRGDVGDARGSGDFAQLARLHRDGDRLVPTAYVDDLRTDRPQRIDTGPGAAIEAHVRQHAIPLFQHAAGQGRWQAGLARGTRHRRRQTGLNNRRYGQNGKQKQACAAGQSSPSTH
ncbi:MAG TPA: hypothetical protein VIY71_08170, partial [Solirubrobacterales bacterium]